MAVRTLKLPLEAKVDAVELVIFGRLEFARRWQIRLLPLGHSIATSVAIGIVAYHKPVVDPLGRLQMHYATISVLVLEVEEPVFAILRIDPRTLMRAVDLRLALREADIFLIRAIRVLRAEFDLPAVLHAARRTHYIIIAVALVELRALDGRLVLVAVIDDARGANDLRALGVHRSNEKHRLHARTRAGASVAQVSLAVLVPQRAAVNQTLALHHPDHRLPLAGRILRARHEQTLVGVAAIDVEPAVVIAD